MSNPIAISDWVTARFVTDTDSFSRLTTSPSSDLDNLEEIEPHQEEREIESNSKPCRPRVELPCLAFHHCDHSTTLVNVSGHKLIDARDADELLRNKVICPTAQGFLLVSDPDNHSTFLWNPLDGEKVVLPHLSGVDDTVLMDSHWHCLLSGKPDAPGCTVVIVECSDSGLNFYSCYIKKKLLFYL